MVYNPTYRVLIISIYSKWLWAHVLSLQKAFKKRQIWGGPKSKRWVGKSITGFWAHLSCTWWLNQPIWKMLVKLYHSPRFRGENQKNMSKNMVSTTIFHGFLKERKENETKIWSTPNSPVTSFCNQALATTSRPKRLQWGASFQVPGRKRRGRPPQHPSTHGPVIDPKARSCSFKFRDFFVINPMTDPWEWYIWPNGIIFQHPKISLRDSRVRYIYRSMNGEFLFSCR